VEHAGNFNKVTRMGVLEDMKESGEAEMVMDRVYWKQMMWRFGMWFGC
jgi:hypothetical protein